MTKPNINVTPLIDVLLVLLIIFMVVTPMKPSNFRTKIPQPPKNETPAHVDPQTMVVSVGPDSMLSVNTRPTAATVQDPQAVIDSLKTTFQEREENLVAERTVFVKAPRKLPYGDIAKVVDAVKMSGAEPISLQIDALE